MSKNAHQHIATLVICGLLTALGVVLVLSAVVLLNLRARPRV